MRFVASSLLEKGTVVAFARKIFSPWSSNALELTIPPRPIHTYSGQATLKPNLPEPQQHAIIYTSEHPPNEYWYQTADGTVVAEDLSKDPIKVHREQKGPEGDLGTLSRINYSKVYTIENYVRVLNIGMVEDDWIPTLKYNSFLKPRESPIEKPRNPRRMSSKQEDDKSKGKGRKRH